MENYQVTSIVNRMLEQNDYMKEQNRLLMCIGCALDKIADKLECIEMTMRKN
jgi:hypothetical protein